MVVGIINNNNKAAWEASSTSLEVVKVPTDNRQDLNRDMVAHLSNSITDMVHINLLNNREEDSLARETSKGDDENVLYTTLLRLTTL